MEKSSQLKFSIIIPIYNTEKYLVECIESVINQTFKNLEIILVNDGSQGNAEEICTNFIKKDSRIKYFSKINEGVAIARNFGISKASGDYIFCLDSDDTIENKFIEKIISKLTKNFEDLVIVGKYFCAKPIDLVGALPTCAFAVKKSFLEKYPDIRFVENIQPCEDGLFSHKLLALTKNITKCPDAQYYYRQHEHSSEHTIDFSKIIKDIPYWFKNLEDFYDKYNLWETHKLHLLAFIENEPYSLRFCSKKLKYKKKLEIFKLIHNFIKKHHLYINNNFFNYKFITFINSKNLLDYTFNLLIKKIIKKRRRKISYCWQCKNAGDDFNKTLLDKLKIKYKKVDYSKCELVLIGSNLDNFINNNKNTIKNKKIKVIGTGFIEKEKKNEKLICKLEIFAIRGQLSLNRLKKLMDFKMEPVVADPGILVSYIFPFNLKPIYDLGIIPHYIDKNEILSNIKLKKYSYKIIDIQQDVEKVCKEINRCKCIISSSLHGLIFSDSYSIPNRQILISNNVYGNNYKFKDYYTMYNQKYIEPIDIRTTIIDDKTVDNIIKNYNSKIEIIKIKQEELIFILKNLV